MAQTSVIHPPQRGFPDDEFETRTAKAQALMADHGLGALLLTTEPEVRYFTGFLTQFWQSPTRPWFVIVPAQGKPIAVIPQIGGECMGRTWIDDIRTWPSPTPEDEGISLLSEAIRDVMGETGSLGMMRGPETHLRMPQAHFDALMATLDGVVIQDCTDIVRGMRMVKSVREIEKISYVCDTVSGVFESLPKLIHTGMTDADIFRRFKMACLEAGADDAAYVVGALGQGGYGDIISPPAGRVAETGDVLILDTGCTFDGYFCDFDRNYAFGEADDAAHAAHDAVWRATETGFEVARPGTTCEELCAAMAAVMEEAGAMGNDVGRLGHGLGMQLTEWPSNRIGDKTVIEPNMVLTLEPGMTFAPGKVMVHEENIVIREDGAEWLTRRAPREMPVIS